MAIEIFEDSQECTTAIEIFQLKNIKQTLNRVIIANDNLQGEFEGWI